MNEFETNDLMVTEEETTDVKVYDLEPISEYESEGGSIAGKVVKTLLVAGIAAGGAYLVATKEKRAAKKAAKEEAKKQELINQLKAEGYIIEEPDFVEVETVDIETVEVVQEETTENK